MGFSIITGRTVNQLIADRKAECIEIVKEAYLEHARGDTINPNSCFLRYPNHPDRRIIALPAHIDGASPVSGLKWIASYPENIKRNLQRASAVVILNSAETGYPFACMEGSLISAARTAASAVLATEHLCQSPKHIHSLGIVGTGFIARNIYQFFVDSGWTIDRLLLHDLNSNESTAFLDTHCRTTGHRGGVETVDLDVAIRNSEVILFSTTTATPYFAKTELISHNPVLLNISLRDLAPEILLASQNVVDDIDHVLNANTSPHLVEQQLGSRDFINGTLAQVMDGNCSIDSKRPVVFSPFGLGMLDLKVAMWIYEQAVATSSNVPIDDFF